MVTVSAMLPVNIPRFTSSSSQVQGENSQSSAQAAQWAATNGDVQEPGDVDFDLLAEYLLDDSAAMGTHTVGMPQFDFSEAASGSGFVSPEQSDDGTPQGTPPTFAAPGVVPPQQQMYAPNQSQMHPHGMISIPIGMTMVGAPGPASFPRLPNPVPSPMPSASGAIVRQNTALAPDANMVLQAPKRKRVDGPTQVYAGAPGAQTPLFTSGHVAVQSAMLGRGRQKSQAQVDRRRERNRILARRTRLRKKFFFESLQKDVTDLQRENNILRSLVQKTFSPEAANQLLTECNAMESLPSAVHEAIFENSDLDGQDFNLVRSIQRSQQCFIITDPSLQDNPIVYASDDFLTLTGYEREEVLGRNCRFLQGTETSAQKVEHVRKAISMGDDVSVTLINYTADGTAFWNKLFIAALRDAHNNIVNFIGVIVKVAAPEPNDPEAGKRLPGEQESPANGDGDVGDDDDEYDNEL